MGRWAKRRVSVWQSDNPHPAVCLVHAHKYDVIHFGMYTVNRECLLIKNILICACKPMVKVKHFSQQLPVSIASSLSTVGDRAFPITTARLWISCLSHVTTALSLSNFCSLNYHLFSLSYPNFWCFFSCSVPAQWLVILDTIIYANADEAADAYMFYRCFFLFFAFSVRHKNTRQPFSGRAEWIFMKQNVVSNVVPKWGLGPRLIFWGLKTTHCALGSDAWRVTEN